MGVVFFRKWLVIWHPDFEKIGMYKSIRFLLSVLRFLLIIFLLSIKIISFFEEKKLKQFDVEDQQMMTDGIVFVGGFLYVMLELIILFSLYLYSKIIKDK